MSRLKPKVLELGCGSGSNTWFLSKEGFDTYGIDNSPTALELCKQTLAQWGTPATLTLGEMTKLPYPDNFFDFVVDVVSMQHLNLQEHEQCISEIKRVLKKGGRFFSFHLGSNSISNQGKKLDECTVENIPQGLPLENNGPTCFLTEKKVWELLQDFEVNIETITRTYNGKPVEYLIIEAIKSVD